MPEKEFRSQDIVGKRFERSLAIREANVDDENRTVELAFSSNEPVYHWFGYMILDHSRGSVNLDRLEQTGALLWSHQMREQIGAIESVTLDEKEGKCRATAKFSRSVAGEENFQDVKDGIKRSVSFGFMVHDLEPHLDEDGNHIMKDEEYVYISRNWEPYEISLVSVPADISVGVGRSLDREKPEQDYASKDAILARSNNSMKENENPTPATPVEAEQSPAATAESAAVRRATEFAAFGAVYGEQDLARNLSLDLSKTLDDVRAAILAKREKANPIPPEPAAAAAERAGVFEPATITPRHGKLKAFRGKDGERQAYRAGMAALAQLTGDENAIRYCREHGISLTRTNTGRENAAGGVFVTPELESAIIDLRIMYGVVRANANVVGMDSDTKLINRRTGGSTAYPVGPGGRGTKSKPTYDRVELIARKWMVLNKIEDELTEDAIVSFIDRFADEAAYAFAYAEDNAGFNGDGSSDYHGIVGIRTKIAAATASLQTASGNAWSEITSTDLLGVVGKLPQFARKSGNVKWYCSAEFWATVLQRIALAAGGVTHERGPGEFLGVRQSGMPGFKLANLIRDIPLLEQARNAAIELFDRDPKLKDK
ncbi:MAG TPA: phage major capsid protein, partial [Pyrinomonadaceae bacterium]|nr:phage major capsid protein [Pyrinomonadaceae bacterium]